MDIFNRYMSGGIPGIFGPSPEQYWGTLVDEVGTPSQMFTRLILSIYKFLKATAEDRAPQMLPRGAQPYLTPEMFANLLDALSIGPLNFDDSDTKNFQITTPDQAPRILHRHESRPQPHRAPQRAREQDAIAATQRAGCILAITHPNRPAGDAAEC